jgi:hypothetical protein
LRALRALQTGDALGTYLAWFALWTLQTLVALFAGLADDTALTLFTGQTRRALLARRTG